MNNVLNTIDQQIYEMGQKRPKSDRAEKSVKLIQQYLESSVLHADMNLNANIENESLLVLYEVIMEDVNTVIDVECGESTIKSASTGIDPYPDEIADSIILNSTAYFSKYQAHHPGIVEFKAAETFVEAISFGIDKGFAEARNMLDELMVLDGDVERNIDIAYDFVQIGLQEFSGRFV